MLNFNLTKKDIGYLRLLIDIQSCEDEKRTSKSSIYADSDTLSNYSVYDTTSIKLAKNN